MRGRANLIIDAHIELVLVRDPVAACIVVIRRAVLRTRRIRQRNQFEQVERLGRKILVRDEVVRKRHRTRETCHTGIVDLALRRPAAGKKLAEIAASPGEARVMGQGRWDGCLSGSAVPLPDTLVVAEEECFVLQNRPTHRPSKLTVERRRSQSGCQRGIGRELGIGISGQLGPASPVIKGVPMEPIGSRLGLHVYYGGD